ncbi:DUF4132 domain-containing protein [Dactylosporangium sp. NPDC048998]|uniref:DUF4132 domain-containing protein n=1 Tax=Dactylosporangium sp. NPDC048998 TaxID=3363976 RepID=UPI0037208C2A
MTEQTFVLPASWRRSIHPRRGGVPVGYEPAGAALPDASVARRPLAHAETPEDLRAAGLAVLDGGAEPTPLGVAAMWAALLGTGARYAIDDVRAVGDDWIARHGVVFAARAGAEFAGLWVTSRHWRDHEDGPLSLARLAGQGERSSAHISELVLGPIRAALAEAPDDVYAQAVRALGAARAGSIFTRLAASFLAPAEQDWVEQDARDVPAQHSHAVLLMASVRTAEQAAMVVPRLDDSGWWHLHTAVMLHTLAEGIGDGILDVFDDDWAGGTGIASGYSGTEFLRLMAGALAATPTDRAFQALLDRAARRGVQTAVADAADRFPVRAMRLLEASADRPRVGELLRRHVARHPDLAPERLRPAAGTGVAEAPPEALPAVLATPPWTARRKVARPVVLADLRCTDAPAVSWRPGERERLMVLVRATPPVRPGPHRDYEALAEGVRAGTARHWDARSLFLAGPQELAGPLLEAYRPGRREDSRWWLPQAAARFGVAAIPPILHHVRQRPADGAMLMPFTSPEIALLVADWHARLKAARRFASAWLRAHPAEASRALVPAALAKPGPQRRRAERALLALADAGHRDAVLGAAAGHGEAAAAAIAALLDADPLARQLPSRIPEPPEWADPAVLPPVRLRDGAGILSATAVRHLLTMLMISKLGDPYAGIAHVRQACEPHDLARLGWELLCRWEEADAPPAGSWALDAQAVLGDDESAAQLADLVQRWPYAGAHKRAAAGLDALAAFGTEAALRLLHELSTKAKAPAVRTRAGQNLTEAADALGLTSEQLADRLVPRFDLAADATTVLDYGPRRFVAGFDEQLKPYVADEDGARRKDLPPPAASDDAELAAAARQRFAAAKKGARKVATEQVRRLEQAMVGGRRWRAAEFRMVFLEHPLLWQLARRLVWITGEGPDRPGAALRIAEDRSLADVADEPVRLPDDAFLGVAHPVDLDVPAWSEVFADYGILQPLRQLGREVHRLGDDERAATRLGRFNERKALSVKVIGLERRGWRREGREGDHQSRMERDLPGGALLIVDLDPGIALGDPAHFPEQRFSDVWICAPGADPWSRERSVPFSALDAASASELLHDLGSCV